MNGLQLMTVCLLIAVQQGYSKNVKKVECFNGWEYIHRACYRFDENPKTWDEAKASCAESGGSLISINSRIEWTKIKRAVQLRITTDNMITWWVGLRRDGTTKRFDKWIDGSSFSPRVVRWSPGEPNNRRNNENCVEFKFDGKINDKSCDSAKPFVCELVEITDRPIQSTAPATTVASTTKAAIFTPITTAAITTAMKEVTSPKPNEEKPSTQEIVPKSDLETTTKISTPPTTERPVLTTEITTTKHSVVEEEEDLTIYKECFNYDKIVESRKIRERQTSVNILQRDDSEVCPSIEASDVVWPETGRGQSASVPCKKGTGVATFFCGDNPVCWRSEPDVSGCVSPKFKKLLEKSEKIFKKFKPSKPGSVQSPKPQEISFNETLEVTEALATVTANDDVSVADVMLTSQVIQSLGNSKFTEGKKTEKEVKNIVKNVVKAGSNLVSKNKTATWSEMKKDDRIRSATTLLAAMEAATVTMADTIEHPVVIETKDENIDMQLRVVNISSLDSKPMVYGEENESDVKFSIPTETLSMLSKGGLAKAVFITHKKMADILDEKDIQDTEDKNVVIKPKIASYIFSATLGGEHQGKLPEPISFTMKHVKSFEANSIPLCSFLDMRVGSRGTWSQEGCVVINSDDKQTTCQCDHMTNFAILMDVQGVEMATVHVFLLRFVTLVGCVISIICLFICFITFNWFSSIQGERNSIHKNLVFALFVAEMLFLVGIDKTEDKLICSLIAGFLHYFFLTAFMWMFLEGLHIICMLVQVFDAAKSRMPYYYFVGYGFPLAIVAISAGIFHQGYGTDTFCWLTTERNFIWSFAGPVAVILAINVLVLIYAMSTVCRHAEYVFSSKENSSGDMRAWIQGALAIEVILGLTWVFGYCYISQDTMAFAYLFTVLNSLQGLFIFCFHCLLNKKVMKEYRRIFHITKRPGTSTQTASLMRKPGTGTSHEMSQPSQSLTHSNTDSRA